MQGGRLKIEIEDIRMTGSEAEAELNYWFINDALVIAGYEFDAEDVTVNTLAEVLDDKYGRHEKGDQARVEALLDAFAGPDDGREVRTLNPAGTFLAWEVGTGAYIVLTDAFSDDLDDIEVFYFDEPTLLAAVDMSVSEPAPALDF